MLNGDGADPAGYLADSLIALATRLPIQEVRDCLETLEGEGLAQRSLGKDGYSAYITAKGRQVLRRSLTVTGAGEPTTPPPAQIVPKGLRSFDEGDKDFFLELVPGPVRNGLPESIHFWKSRTEETDPDKTFRVGVLYGPSDSPPSGGSPSKSTGRLTTPSPGSGRGRSGAATASRRSTAGPRDGGRNARSGASTRPSKRGEGADRMPERGRSRAPSQRAGGLITRK
jgi:hypothetical protein